MTVQFPMMRLKLPGGGGMSVTPYPTLKFNLLVPASIKLQFLPAIPGSNIHGKVNRSGDTMGGSLILDHDPVIPLEAATKQYVDFVGASGVTPGDKGDITVGGGGGWTIDNDVVTYAKMQNISAGSLLLGRGDSGAGDPQEIVLGSNLIMSGTTLNASGGTSISAPPTTDNAIVRWDGVTGALIQNSGVLVNDQGCMQIFPVAPTSPALTLYHTTTDQLLRSVSIPTGTSALSTSLNTFLVVDDQIQVAGTGVTVALDVAHLVITGGDKGAKQALNAQFRRDAASDPTTGIYQDVAFGASFSSSANNNGSTPTVLGAHGNGYAMFATGQLLAGATSWGVVCGNEIDMAIETGASAAYLVGLQISLLPNHQVPGNEFESALSFTNNVGAVGWSKLISLNNTGGEYPMTSTGVVFSTFGAQTFGTFIDVSSATITGNAWKSTGAQIDGSGAFVFSSATTNVIISTNIAPLLIGSTGAGNTAPILDNATAGRATVWAYADASVIKWYAGKAADNSYAVLDASTVHTVLSSALGSDAIRLGTVGTNGGKLLFSGSASGTVGVQVASAAGTWDLTLPTTGGTAGYFLQTNGSGVSTWAAAPGAGAGSPGGATTHVQFNTAGVFDGDDEFTYDSAGAITLGKATGGSGTIKLKGSTSGTVTVEPAPAAGTWTLRLPVDDGDAGEVLTTDGAGVTSWEAAAAGREVVATARTYYVNNVTGNDADDGLTAPNAFATIQKAVNIICDDIYWLSAQCTVIVAKTGVNYDEQVLLRPWLGSTPFSNSYDVHSIQGDLSDPSYATGVVVKPTSVASARGVFTAFGEGARWSTVAISVDQSASPTTESCYASVGGAYYRPSGGDLRSGDLATSQLFAINGGQIHWDAHAYDYGAGFVLIPSHITAVSMTPDYNVMAWAITDATININTPIEFDNNPAYWIVAWAEQNSFFQYYHQAAFTGVHPTGQRIFLRENSRGNSNVALASIPGDDWTSSGYGFAVSQDSLFNYPHFFPYGAFASLPTVAVEGMVISIIDSPTNTPGAAVTVGGGSHHVPLWYTGSGWVVLAPVTGGGGGGSVTVDVLEDILASTPTSGAMALATDVDQMLIADGTDWHIDSSYYTVKPEEPDLGWETANNRIGYGRDYVTDKLIANCTIGYGTFDTTADDGGIRFNADVGTFGAFELYAEGEWHSVVAGLVLTEQEDLSQAITQTPIGKTEEIIVFNGDSVLRGLNDVPLIQGYIACLGSFPPLQRVTGGTF